MNRIGEDLPRVMAGIAAARQNARDIPDSEHERQAQAFLGFRRKHPAVHWEDLLVTWSASKDLALSDLWAIRRIIRDELIARGQAVFTALEPPDAA